MNGTLCWQEFIGVIDKVAVSGIDESLQHAMSMTAPAHIRFLCEHSL
jgi:hypothetical protein